MGRIREPPSSCFFPDIVAETSKSYPQLSSEHAAKGRLARLATSTKSEHAIHTLTGETAVVSHLSALPNLWDRAFALECQEPESRFRGASMSQNKPHVSVPKMPNRPYKEQRRISLFRTNLLGSAGNTTHLIPRHPR